MLADPEHDGVRVQADGEMLTRAPGEGELQQLDEKAPLNIADQITSQT